MKRKALIITLAIILVIICTAVVWLAVGFFGFFGKNEEGSITISSPDGRYELLLEDWHALGGGGTDVYQVHGIFKTHLGEIPRSQWELPISKNFDDLCKVVWSEESVTFTVKHNGGKFYRDYTYNLSDKYEMPTVFCFLIPIGSGVFAAVVVAIVVIRRRRKTGST